MDLDQLLFYSSPGGICLAGLYFAFPGLFNADHVPYVIASAPVVGYVFHSFERMIFGLFGGYFRPTREVIDVLSKMFPYASWREDELYQYWRMGRYSGSFPEPLATQIKRSWHFAHGLCTSIYAALFSAALLGGALIGNVYAYDPAREVHRLTAKTGYVVALVGAAVMWANLCYLWEDIRQLEASILHVYGRQLFRNIVLAGTWEGRIDDTRGRRRRLCAKQAIIVARLLAVLLICVPLLLSLQFNNSVLQFVSLWGGGFLLVCILLQLSRPRLLISRKPTKSSHDQGPAQATEL